MAVINFRCDWFVQLGANCPQNDRLAPRLTFYGDTDGGVIKLFIARSHNDSMWPSSSVMSNRGFGSRSSSMPQPSIFLLILVLTVYTSVNSASIPSERKRFPDAIIIGVKKCGTRALLEFLKLNSRIKAPGPEVHFFDKHYDLGYDWYREQMPVTNATDITIEKSPAYFIGKSVPERVYKMNPKMKLIVVVRNPVTRAISDYTQAATRKKRSLFTSKFEELVSCFNESHPSCQAGVNASWGAVRIGIYHRYLHRWLEYFPLHQMQFVDGERLITEPASQIRPVEKFLGLSPVVKKRDFIFDSVKKFPCIKKFNGTVHCLGKSKGRPHPKVSPATMRKLSDFYRTENEKFFNMINRRFNWL
uniref:Sulfotransfer_1 domain-containing protein n=1 Tax=Panagrellus redivivus TaxID=6233 RepID=A0A7E4ZZL0_PANRE